MGGGVAIATKRWTLAELHRLPEDGNKYELVRGELFVTPPPSEDHEVIASRLTELLIPYVRDQNLGIVFRPRAVMRFAGSEVEPDLMVRVSHPDRRGNDSDWTRAPIPRLVVEILSPFTRRRDHNQKRDLYLEAGVEQYWIVDPEQRAITVCRSGEMDQVCSDVLTWQPLGTTAPLSFETRSLFN